MMISVYNPHIERIFKKVEEIGPCDRDSLLEEVDMPRTSVYDYLRKLIQKGRILWTPLREFDDRGCKRGRPRVIFYLPSQVKKIAIRVKGRVLQVGPINREGVIDE